MSWNRIKPGFKNIISQPHFVEGLDDIKVSHKGRFGNIVSAWKKEGETVNYTVIIPPNSKAELRFDASVKQLTKKGKNEVLDLDSSITLEAGKYEFIVK